MALKYKNKKVISVQDWDNLVRETYGKPYSFQQQDGCKYRGMFDLTVPSDYTNEEEMNDSIPEKVNGGERGVKFEVWLARDPKQSLEGEKSRSDKLGIDLFWKRNFYPDINTVANDLYKKGLIEKGEYNIEIDW